MTYREAKGTILFTIIILLVSILLLIPSKFYSDIRGEFAKRPTALPPEPAAVVNYLVEDISNARAASKRICYSGMRISVNLNQLPAITSFFDAVDQALINAGLGGFTWRDFLDSPDSTSSTTQPNTPNNALKKFNYYQDITNIAIDVSGTDIKLSLNPKFASGATPPGQYDCSQLISGGAGLCNVLSACGWSTTVTGASIQVGGCLVTSNSKDSLGKITSQILPDITIETLSGGGAVYQPIPRYYYYFANPALLGVGDSYTLVAQQNASGNVAGCFNTAFQTSSACGDGSTQITQSGVDSFYQINKIASVASNVQYVQLSTVPTRNYILGFLINTCPP